mmetsp:Transcript_16508/g.29375  ORF Transcript_16508/g.29375 Transcript_16508/m.29375 type:complete len:326 (-) Transcript_16508:146-1123(-)
MTGTDSHFHPRACLITIHAPIAIYASITSSTHPMAGNYDSGDVCPCLPASANTTALHTIVTIPSEVARIVPATGTLIQAHNTVPSAHAFGALLTRVVPNTIAGKAQACSVACCALKTSATTSACIASTTGALPCAQFAPVTRLAALTRIPSPVSQLLIGVAQTDINAGGAASVTAATVVLKTTWANQEAADTKIRPVAYVAFHPIPVTRHVIVAATARPIGNAIAVAVAYIIDASRALNAAVNCPVPRITYAGAVTLCGVVAETMTSTWQLPTPGTNPVAIKSKRTGVTNTFTAHASPADTPVETPRAVIALPTALTDAATIKAK